MKNWLLIFQIGLSVLMIMAILLQAQGSGLGSSWGGGGETYHTRRGLEKVVFYATIIGLVLFILVSLAIFLV